MKARAYLSLIALLSSTVAGCSGGGDNSPQCSFKDPAMLAPSAWPKFRHDVRNTGAVENAEIPSTAAQAQCRWVFPAPPLPPKGPFPASPVLNAVEDLVYVGSTDGALYAIQTADGELRSTFNFSTNLQQPITGAALLGLREGLPGSPEAVFVGGGDGRLAALDEQGNAQPTNWPFLSTAFVSAAPTLGADGTLYVADLSGLFSGVCPNGVARFSLSTIGLESSPAIGPDGTVYFGTDDNQLRAIQPDGIVKWVFSASAPIVAAPVVEVTNGTTAAIYVTDVAGRIFKIDSNGKPVAGFSFTGDDCPGRNPPQVGRISSSPALAGGHLYVGSEDGNLYAVRTDTGCIEWTFPSAGTCASPAATAGRACTTQSECDSAQRAGDGLCERTPIVSSPAVATNGGDRTVVVGSNGGHVYFVPDQENTFGTPVVFTPAESCTGVARAPIRSSPAIGSDGTVYVGADDGRVYAIGAPL